VVSAGDYGRPPDGGSFHRPRLEIFPIGLMPDENILEPGRIRNWCIRSRRG
jgi:hypothetical protein